MAAQMEPMGHNDLEMATVIANPMVEPQPDPAADGSGCTVSFHDICYTVQLKRAFSWRGCHRPEEKKILLGLSGIMKPGLNAILGPSGCGKSSFLDILAARKDPSGLSGEVLIDGAPQPPNFKCLSGYVVQDDVVMGSLTVRQNLRFSAALRLPESVPQREKEARVNHLITELGLTKVADSKVGTQLVRGISGGERKRTSIGMELIMDPAVLFLDEPTTGLDASTACTVLLLLKRMAEQGKNIILSIHQPRYSIYRLFDTLTLLVSGKLVYHGRAQSALAVFNKIGYHCEQNDNPADFFLDVINGNHTAAPVPPLGACPEVLDCNTIGRARQGVKERLLNEYRQTTDFQNTKTELECIIEKKAIVPRPKSRTVTYNSSFFHQLQWVLRRTFLNLLMQPQISLTPLGVSTFLSLLVGAAFFGVKDDQPGLQNRMGALFFVTVNQCFGTVSSAELFIRERTLFNHEYISGYYRVSVYFIAKMLSDLVWRSVIISVFSCIVYFMIGFKSTPENFFIFLLTMLLVSYAATSLTVAVSADQTVISVANVIMSMCFVVMMLFSGLLVNLPSVMAWLSWVKYLSIPRYGFTALNINELVGLNFCGDTATQNGTGSSVMANCTGSVGGLLCSGEQHLEYQGIDYSYWGLWQNHLALALMMILFQTIAYLKLRFIKKFS
ncbi:broad substrate specificity ATP-binding cassette transporter ABCG2d [Acanthochromis polyacanthus]|uniref:broad substrate specificity ATP-binding cassette transporter ABCG2d n=1 Tax=Acanthochromis polyacanthus TaxID=80966 RepID=UPI0022345576|nr:broad substrate specificity ATP-binding cassette transporter ABCG2d [Acanthochromis polyacanthus]